MAAKRHAVLIVAPPGPLRNGLQVLLAAIPRLAVATPVDSRPAALQQIRAHPPATVLIDFNPANNDTPALVQQIKTGWPHIHCVVLVSSRWQEQAASAAGADAILRQGVAPAEIVATFERLAEPATK